MNEPHAVPIYRMYDKNGKQQLGCKVKEMHAGYTDRTPHVYDELKIVHVCRGSADWQVNGAVHPVQRDDILVFNHLDIRRITVVTSAEPLVVEQICFYPNLLYPHHNTANFFYQRGHGFCNLVDRASPDRPRLLADYRELYEEARRETPYRESMILNLLAHMVLLLARGCSGAEKPGELPHEDTVRGIMAYIASHPSGDLSLGALAARANLSESYFSRVFKAVSGVGVREYVTRTRVIRVIDCMAAEPDANVLDLAFTCGFNTSSGFYHAFESVAGTSPKLFAHAYAAEETGTGMR